VGHARNITIITWQCVLTWRIIALSLSTQSNLRNIEERKNGGGSEIDTCDSSALI
jgi:hypothetical protein